MGSPSPLNGIAAVEPAGSLHMYNTIGCGLSKQHKTDYTSRALPVHDAVIGFEPAGFLQVGILTVGLTTGLSVLQGQLHTVSCCSMGYSAGPNLQRIRRNLHICLALQPGIGACDKSQAGQRPASMPTCWQPTHCSCSPPSTSHSMASWINNRSW